MLKAMLNAMLSLILIFGGIIVTKPVYAYEALTGPTGVLKFVREKVFDGYTLFSPNEHTNTYLIDNEGQIVHEWKSQYHPGAYAVLLDSGNLLRGIQDKPWPVPIGGNAGGVQEIDWDGNVVWEYKLKTDDTIHHHSFHRMPNGNTLLIAFERVSQKKLMELGREKGFKPFKKGDTEVKDFWIDFIREVNPGGETVWEWHMIDHLGAGKDKLNINYSLPDGKDYDWSHLNQIEYHSDTDTILVNSRTLGEFYLIDHKTGHITYRWGNNTTWNPDAKKPYWMNAGDQILFAPHGTYRLANGNYLIFDNGAGRPDTQRSRAFEMDPETGEIVWEYSSRVSNSFTSTAQGSAQRLPNGNTLICSANHGHIFEVTPEKSVVWEFINPIAKGVAKSILMDEVDGSTTGPSKTTNTMHRAYKYPKDHPAFNGKDLSPKGYIGGEMPVFYKVWKYDQKN